MEPLHLQLVSEGGGFGEPGLWLVSEGRWFESLMFIAGVRSEVVLGTRVCSWCQMGGCLGDLGVQVVSEGGRSWGPRFAAGVRSKCGLGACGRTVPRLQGLNQAAGTHLGANMQNVNPLGSDPHCPPPCCAYSSGFAPGSEIR